MYNFARHHQQQIPLDFKAEDVMFRTKPRQQSMQEDVMALKRIMVENNLKDPKDALAQIGDVDHWSYLKQFRPRYLKEVFHEAVKTADDLAAQFRNHPEQFPLPQPQGQGGGGGAPPGGAMASARGRTVLATYVLPDGAILIKEGNDYMVHDVDGAIEFYSEAGSQAAMEIAMIKIAAKGKEADKRN